MLPNFNPLRRLEVFFLAFYSRFHGRHYLTLCQKLTRPLAANITGSDVIGPTRKIPLLYSAAVISLRNMTTVLIVETYFSSYSIIFSFKVLIVVLEKLHKTTKLFKKES